MYPQEMRGATMSKVLFYWVGKTGQWNPHQTGAKGERMDGSEKIKRLM